MAENDQEKTEAPTPHKLSEARKKGNVTKSQDLTAAVAMMAGILLLWLLGGHMFDGFRHLVESMLDGDSHANPTRLDDMAPMISRAVLLGISILGPVMLCLLVAMMLINLFQVGPLWTTHPIQPNFNKLDPIKGFKRLVDVAALMRLVMSVGKLAVIAAASIWYIWSDVARIAAMSRLEPMAFFLAGAELVFALGLKLSLLLMVLGIGDYLFQRWKRQKDLRMSKQEVKEEHKRMDGDPLIKQRRTQVARRLAMQRLSAAVPTADVVVTNPTHFAVALRYDSKTMRAPKVVAKGADLMAFRIRQLAAQHRIPILERKELARAMYRGVDVGQEIPAEFYSAMAEILAYVYRIGGKKAA
ncbi:MAG: flagellar biosynthesis protein FlhB [Phycisphaeraceae bacterium]|nr:flagellar biosynthesis protein FlhB [Phycisphaeraceae bacterium]